jgi:hypothetical protein
MSVVTALTLAQGVRSDKEDGRRFASAATRWGGNSEQSAKKLLSQRALEHPVRFLIGSLCVALGGLRGLLLRRLGILARCGEQGAVLVAERRARAKRQHGEERCQHHLRGSHVLFSWPSWSMGALRTDAAWLQEETKVE